MAEAPVSRDLVELIPGLAEAVPGCTYNKEIGTVGFWVGDAYVVVFPDKVWVYGAADTDHVVSVLEGVDRMLASLLAAPSG